MDARIIGDVAVLGHLRVQLEHDGRLLEQLGHGVEEVVVRLGLGLVVGERLESGLGNDAVAHKGLVAGAVDERDGIDAEELLGREARREGLGQLHKGQRLGVRAEVVADGAVGQRPEEGERLVAVAAREGVHRVRDDVGVHAARRLGQLEAHG